MTFGAPLGLLALLGLLPLTLAYFLRRKQRPLRVSALFLWRDPNPSAEAGPRFERFTRELSFLLEALAIVAAALFLADLRFGAAQLERHLVLVVDGSLSMSARTASGPVRERVRRHAAELVERERATVVSIVESGVTPRLLAGPQARASEALAELERWTPLGASHELGPALMLGRELGGPGRRLALITDAPLPDATARPAEVEIVAVGEPAENLALVAAQRADEGGVATVSARLVNFSAAEVQVPVRFEAADPAGGAPVQRTEQVKLGPSGTAALEARFEHAADIAIALPEDALPSDGRVVLVPSAQPKVQLRALDGLDPATLTALGRVAAVSPGVRLGGADAGVGEAVVTIGPRGANADLTIGAPGEGRTYLGPFFADKADPLLEDVDLVGVRWTAGDNPPGRGRVTAGQTALFSEEDDGRLHLNLELGRSNLQRTVAWPVLIGNILRRARANVAGLPRRQLLLGEEVPVVTSGRGRYVLRGPGYERPVLGVGRVQLPPLHRPGRYTLERDGEPVDAMEVLALDARESDLTDRASGVQPAAASEGIGARTLPEPRSVHPLLAMLLLLLADWWLTRRATA